MIADLRHRILTIAQQDQAATERIRHRGDLEDTYHEELEKIHVANANQIEAIIDEYGLPGRLLVGDDGAEAVWLIIQHAISLPQFQKRCLSLLQDAASRGEFPLAYPAYLEDRIRFHEGKPQRYGTLYDWDESGELSPYDVEDEQEVDMLRTSVGLSSLAENTARMRSGAGKPPKDYSNKKQEYESWLKKVGWR